MKRREDEKKEPLQHARDFCCGPRQNAKKMNRTLMNPTITINLTDVVEFTGPRTESSKQSQQLKQARH